MTTEHFDYLVNGPGLPCPDGAHDWVDVGVEPDPYCRPLSFDPYVPRPEQYVYVIRCKGCHIERYRLLDR